MSGGTTDEVTVGTAQRALLLMTVRQQTINGDKHAMPLPAAPAHPSSETVRLALETVNDAL